MFGYWLIVLCSANQILRVYVNQEISNYPEADDPYLPVIMVDKSDGTIDCMDYFSKAGAPAKPEIIIQTRKSS